MRMNDLGEKEFLAKMLPGLNPHRSFVNRFGDDAAVLDIPLGESQRVVFKIDRAAQPTATRRGWADNSMWGRLAVTATCSDILAAGAIPKALMLACILPGDFEASQAFAIVEGCANECAEHDVAFVGGDTKEGPSPEIVSSGIGVTLNESYLGRQGASPGDAVVVAGQLGGYLGSYLQLIELADAAPARRDQWVHYITHPRAQWEAALAMIRSGAPVAAMDCSDGLYDALSVLSGPYGCEIDEATLPYHPLAVECGHSLGLNLLSLALGVGDWNIVYVVPQSRLDQLSSELSSRGTLLTVVGVISDGESSAGHVQVRDEHGRSHRLRPVVNEHFVTRQEDEGTFLEKIAMSPYVE